MAVLAADITASQRSLELEEDTALATYGGYYRIESEVVRITNFGRARGLHGAVQTRKWSVRRGELGTTRATHSAGTEVKAMVDAFAVGANLTPPAPFAAEGDGGLSNPVTEPLVIHVEGEEEALVAETDNAQVVLGETPAGGGLLRLRGTSAFNGAVLVVNDVDGEDGGDIQGDSQGLLQVRYPFGASIVATTGHASGAGTSADQVALDSRRGVTVRLHAAPSDEIIRNGEMCIWFDQTNGAGKLMIKAKTANGTVVTGEVALT